MARSLTAGMITAVTAEVVRPILLAKLDTAGGWVRVWSGIGDLTFNAETYSGVGTFGGVTPIQETAELRANGATFTLSSVPSSMIAMALADMRQGKDAYLWLGLMNIETNALLADPVQIFAGLTDVPVVDEGPNNSMLGISVENRLIDLEKARVRRYTPEDIQLRLSTDTGFNQVGVLQDRQIVFGRS